MSKLFYRPNLEKLLSSSVFGEASKEELRVMLALASLKNAITEEELSTLAGCSVSRCKSAITLFEEEGLLEKSDIPFEEKVIEYEYKGASHFSDADEQSPIEVAKSIKRENLSDLIDECSGMLGKGAFSSNEATRIVSLVTNLSLSGEYITTLLSFLKSKGKCTVTTLVNKAEQLAREGIDDYDSLEEYIRNRELPEYVWEFRRVFGIRGRQPSPSEKEYYRKWAEDFGYGSEIVTLAYDKAALAGSPNSLQYIDTVLSAWNSANCRTVSECEENSKAFKESKSSEKKETSAIKTKSKTKAPTPRYGDFDVEEAFRLALERSYGDNDK